MCTDSRLCYQAAERALSLDPSVSASRRPIVSATKRQSARCHAAVIAAMPYRASRLCYQAAERALSPRRRAGDRSRMSRSLLPSGRARVITSARCQARLQTIAVSATKRQSARYHPDAGADCATVSRSLSLLPSGRARVITSRCDCRSTRWHRDIARLCYQAAERALSPRLALPRDPSSRPVSATKRQSARCHLRPTRPISRTRLAQSLLPSGRARVVTAPLQRPFPCGRARHSRALQKINQYAARNPLFNRAHQRALPRRSHLAWRPRAGSSRR